MNALRGKSIQELEMTPEKENSVCEYSPIFDQRPPARRKRSIDVLEPAKPSRLSVERKEKSRPQLLLPAETNSLLDSPDKLAQDTFQGNTDSLFGSPGTPGSSSVTAPLVGPSALDLLEAVDVSKLPETPVLLPALRSRRSLLLSSPNMANPGVRPEKRKRRILLSDGEDLQPLPGRADRKPEAYKAGNASLEDPPTPVVQLAPQSQEADLCLDQDRARPDDQSDNDDFDLDMDLFDSESVPGRPVAASMFSVSQELCVEAPAGLDEDHEAPGVRRATEGFLNSEGSIILVDLHQTRSDSSRSMLSASPANSVRIRDSAPIVSSPNTSARAEMEARIGSSHFPSSQETVKPLKDAGTIIPETSQRAPSIEEQADLPVVSQLLDRQELDVSPALERRSSPALISSPLVDSRSQNYFDPMMTTQMFRNLDLPAEAAAHTLTSEADYEDPFFSTQILNAVSLSQFNDPSSKGAGCKDDERPLHHLAAAYQPGGSFGTVTRGEIKVNHQMTLLAQKFIQEQHCDYQGGLLDGTALLRKNTNVDSIVKLLQPSTLADISSMQRRVREAQRNGKSAPAPTVTAPEPSKAASDEKAPVSPPLAASEPFADPHESDPHPPLIPPPMEFGGFTTGAGKKLPPPSKAAMALGTAIASAASDSPGWGKMGGFQSGAGKPLPPPSKAALELSTSLFTAGAAPSGMPMSGFSTGAGRALPTPSRSAMERASLLLKSSEPESSHPASKDVFKIPSAPARTLPRSNPSTPSTPAVSRMRAGAQPDTPCATLSSARSLRGAAFKTPVTRATTAGTPVSGSTLRNTPFKQPTISVRKRSTLHANIAVPSSPATPVQKPAAKEVRFVKIPGQRTSYREAFGNARQTTANTALPSSGINGSNALSVTFETEGGVCGAGQAQQVLLDRGCLSSLCTPEWVRNHYRWIVWKMAFLSQRLGAANVWSWDYLTTQLLFRYDTEVYDVKRSAIKRIVEKDGIPSQHMVLFISALSVAGGAVTMELCDGWYAVQAQIDAPLKRLALLGKLSVGQKLHIQGASIVGTSDACPVLEIPAAAALKISSNSTRRAKWDAMLGFQRPPVFTVGVGTLAVDGGFAGCIDVVICRRFPITYAERTAEGKSIMRNAQEEDGAVRDWSVKFDGALQNAQMLFETEPDRFDCNPNDRDAVRQALQEYAEDAVPKRNVSPSCTYLVCDYPVRNGLPGHCRQALVTMYAKSDGFFEEFNEGKRFKFFNVSASSFSGGYINLRFNCNSPSRSCAIDPAVLAQIPYTPRRLLDSQAFSTLTNGMDIDACMVVLGQFVDSHQLKSFKYYVLCTDEHLNLAVVEVTTSTDKSKFFQANSIVCFLNLSFSYCKDGIFKFSLLKYGSYSKSLQSPYKKSPRFAQLKTWISSNPSLPNISPDIMQQY
ncbi:Breast cancer 2, early onset [Kappamyces sp. JEL0829]|nr:Breast cancer 2, early onset [Kappamyces sp. JEL0829]